MSERDDLVAAVAEMRHWQRKRVQTRAQFAQRQSERAEKRVDDLLAVITSGQRTLFEDPDGSRR